MLDFRVTFPILSLVDTKKKEISLFIIQVSTTSPSNAHETDGWRPFRQVLCDTIFVINPRGAGSEPWQWLAKLHLENHEVLSS